MNILYINTSYDFSCGVNANRVFDLLEYFSKNKFNVTHLTPKPPLKVSGIKELTIPYSKNYKESIFEAYFRGLLTLKNNPQQEQWVNDISQYVNKNQTYFKKFDIILINTQPGCLIKLAKLFKEKYNSKIVIDLHDPIAYDPYPPQLLFLTEALKNYEKQLFAYIDCLLVITPSMYPVYREKYPSIQVEYLSHSIPNYVPNPNKGFVMGSVVNIVYGGSLHGQRTIIPLLRSLRFKKTRQFRVIVIGKTSIFTRAKYLKYPEIIWKSPLNRLDYFNYLNREGDIGIVSQSFSMRNKEISGIAAKTYEYLAMNKPIIYIGPSGDNVNILKKYSNNYCLVLKPQGDEIRLRKYLNEFKYLKDNTKHNFYNDFKADVVYSKIQEIFKKLLDK